MNRLQRKYLIISATFHSLLVGLLIIGPAFIPAPVSKPINNNLPLLQFIPSKLVDEMVQGGGRPGPLPPAVKATTPVQSTPLMVKPPAAKPPPKTTPKTAKPIKPAPVESQPIETPKAPQKTDSASFDLAKLKKVTRPRPSAVSTPDENSSAKALAQEKAARQQLFNGVINAIHDRVTTSTKMEPFGEGGTGGPAYANYFQAVMTIYDQAWYDPPAEVTDESLNVVTKIVLARSGKVKRADIIIPSGNRLLDQSIRRVLDRVDVVPRFPDEAKDEERTYSITFNLKAKRPL